MLLSRLLALIDWNTRQPLSAGEKKTARCLSVEMGTPALPIIRQTSAIPQTEVPHHIAGRTPSFPDDQRFDLRYLSLRISSDDTKMYLTNHNYPYVYVLWLRQRTHPYWQAANKDDFAGTSAGQTSRDRLIAKPTRNTQVQPPSTERPTNPAAICSPAFSSGLV